MTRRTKTVGVRSTAVAACLLILMTYFSAAASGAPPDAQCRELMPKALPFVSRDGRYAVDSSVAADLSLMVGTSTLAPKVQGDTAVFTLTPELMRETASLEYNLILNSECSTSRIFGAILQSLASTEDGARLSLVVLAEGDSLTTAERTTVLALADAAQASALYAFVTSGADEGDPALRSNLCTLYEEGSSPCEVEAEVPELPTGAIEERPEPASMAQSRLGAEYVPSVPPAAETEAEGVAADASTRLCRVARYVPPNMPFSTLSNIPISNGVGFGTAYAEPDLDGGGPYVGDARMDTLAQVSNTIQGSAERYVTANLYAVLEARSPPGRRMTVNPRFVYTHMGAAGARVSAPPYVPGVPPGIPGGEGSAVSQFVVRLLSGQGGRLNFVTSGEVFNRVYEALPNAVTGQGTASGDHNEAIRGVGAPPITNVPDSFTLLTAGLRYTTRAAVQYDFGFLNGTATTDLGEAEGRYVRLDYVDWEIATPDIYWDVTPESGAYCVG